MVRGGAQSQSTEGLETALFALLEVGRRGPVEEGPGLSANPRRPKDLRSRHQPPAGTLDPVPGRSEGAFAACAGEETLGPKGGGGATRDGESRGISSARVEAGASDYSPGPGDRPPNNAGTWRVRLNIK